MGKIKTELKNLYEDLLNRKFTDRVKVATAALSCVVIVAAFSALLITAGCKNKNEETTAQSTVEAGDNESVSETGDIKEQTMLSGNELGGSSESVSDSKDENVLDETEDAGEEYIDETLFLGDSNTVRMMNYGITSLKNTLAVVGMGIQSVKTLKCIQFEGYSSPITMVEAVKLLKPRRIIITFGTNNANGMSVDDFIKKYEEALDAVKQAEPSADILINSIPPIAQKNSYPSLSQNSIDKFNNALIKMAAERGYKYIDSASVMKDAATGYAKEGYTVNDGIHISESGFAAMFTYIRTHSHVVKDTTPRPETPLPKQVKATYVVDSNGKMNNDPEAYKEMSEVTAEQQEALKKALEETAKQLEESKKAQCQHTNHRKETVSEATESSTGKIRYICNDCGYIYEETIPKKQSTSSSTSSTASHTHSYSSSVYKEATVNEEGVMRYKCSCGDYYDKPIPKIVVQTPSTSTSSSVTTSTSSSVTTSTTVVETQPSTSTTDIPVTPEPTPEPTQPPSTSTTDIPEQPPEPTPDPTTEPTTETDSTSETESETTEEQTQ